MTNPDHAATIARLEARAQKAENAGWAMSKSYEGACARADEQRARADENHSHVLQLMAELHETRQRVYAIEPSLAAAEARGGGLGARMNEALDFWGKAMADRDAAIAALRELRGMVDRIWHGRVGGMFAYDVIDKVLDAEDDRINPGAGGRGAGGDPT